MTNNNTIFILVVVDESARNSDNSIARVLIFICGDKQTISNSI